ncbi:MAG: heat-inducible transcription repressor HrcA [Acidobacteria bacterium]|nr:heat-inducible transcription repressor HrcA [Acidobacteriota bacterium]
MSVPELNARSAAVLDTIVERYILTGEPVGSGTIARLLDESVSPATVRNVMAELERLGYLEQPHTSAGRMPTRRGYRQYVTGLPVRGLMSDDDARNLRSQIAPDPIEMDELLRRTCHVLADLSELVAVVAAPPLSDTAFRHVDFVALEGNRVLAIVVSRAGQVKKRAVVLSEPMTQDQLDQAAAYLVRRFAGRSLREVTLRIQELLTGAGERLEVFERQAIALGATSITGDLDESEVLVEGSSRLLAAPDVETMGDLRTVFEVIEERRLLALALRAEESSDGPRVVIGCEPLPTGLEHCALVSASYGHLDGPHGTVAVLGPTRLQYARTIALVDAIASATTAALVRLTR